MNKYFLYGAVVVGVVFLGVIAFNFSGGGTLGAVTNYSTAQNQQAVYAWQKDVAQDLANLQAFDLAVQVNTSTGKFTNASSGIATLLTSTTTTP